MRKEAMFRITAVILCLCVFGLQGCQKAPEASDSGGISHAQGETDRKVQEILGGEVPSEGETAPESEGLQEGAPSVGETAPEGGSLQEGASAEETAPAGGFYEGVIGTGENRLAISARIPQIPGALYRITLGINEEMDEDTVLDLLDSREGSIRDTSREYLANLEEIDRNNTSDPEKVLYSLFGDHSAVERKDGKREASVSRGTCAYYKDYALYDRFFEIETKVRAREDLQVSPEEMDEGDFSANDAAGILMDKLKSVGIDEISLGEVLKYEDAHGCCYEFAFTPSYDGTGIVYEKMSTGFGEIYPKGFALIFGEGAAEVSLTDFCGQIRSREAIEIISFDQAVRLLGQYLDGGMIRSKGQNVLNTVKLEYYPLPNPSPKPDEIEYREELELVPVWHFYTPLGEYLEGLWAGEYEDGVSNILVNAVTGELEWSE